MRFAGSAGFLTGRCSWHNGINDIEIDVSNPHQLLAIILIIQEVQAPERAEFHGKTLLHFP